MKIEGVDLVQLDKYPDVRGFFGEVYRKEWVHGFDQSELQLNHSFSRKDVLRGLHYHRWQFDYWYVVRGELQVGLFDLREDSETYKQSDSLILNNSDGLFIPPMVAHGFIALENTDLIYVVNQYYEPEDDRELKWNDTDIDWSFGDLIISDRDANSPSLNEVLDE